jgi:hypothetical protein
VDHERHAAGHQSLQLNSKPSNRIAVLEVDATCGQVLRRPNRDACSIDCRRQWPLAREELAEEEALWIQPLANFNGLLGGDVCKP